VVVHPYLQFRKIVVEGVLGDVVADRIDIDVLDHAGVIILQLLLLGQVHFLGRSLQFQIKGQAWRKLGQDAGVAAAFRSQQGLEFGVVGVQLEIEGLGDRADPDLVGRVQKPASAGDLGYGQGGDDHHWYRQNNHQFFHRIPPLFVGLVILRFPAIDCQSVGKDTWEKWKVSN
jgi:hypothetical protein